MNDGELLPDYTALHQKMYHSSEAGNVSVVADA
jgi:hypothetical protein